MFNKIKYGLVIFGLSAPLVTQAQHCSSFADDPSFVVCDATFINSPVFGEICTASTPPGTSTGIFTLQNNTPQPLMINYIRIQDNDGYSSSASAVIASPFNNCVVGATIAPGSFCDISVELYGAGLAPGTFNRVLQVGINSRQVEVDAAALTATVSACTTPPPTPPAGFTPTIPGTPTYLYSSSILAYSTVTNSGLTVVNGDLDLTPGSSVTGFPPGIIINGVQNINNTAAANVKTAAQNYFTALNALPCNVTYPASTDITTLSPINCSTTPVSCFTSSALMTGAVVLNGGAGDTCTFVIGSTLTVSNNAVLTTAGGILNDNISWAIGSSATLGVNSALIGIIDASASISLNTSATLDGRAWALNGAVTLLNNAVNPQG